MMGNTRRVSTNPAITPVSDPGEANAFPVDPRKLFSQFMPPSGLYGNAAKTGTVVGAAAAGGGSGQPPPTPAADRFSHPSRTLHPQQPHHPAQQQQQQHHHMFSPCGYPGVPDTFYHRSPLHTVFAPQHQQQMHLFSGPAAGGDCEDSPYLPRYAGPQQLSRPGFGGYHQAPPPQRGTLPMHVAAEVLKAGGGGHGTTAARGAVRPAQQLTPFSPDSHAHALGQQASCGVLSPGVVVAPLRPPSHAEAGPWTEAGADGERGGVVQEDDDAVGGGGEGKARCGAAAPAGAENVGLEEDLELDLSGTCKGTLYPPRGFGLCPGSSVFKSKYCCDLAEIPLGIGAYGKVVVAKDRKLEGGLVAVKVLNDEDGVAGSAMREVSALRWLRDCKFIVDFHMAEFQDEERLAFIVMDLYEQDLHKFISQNPAISMIEAKHITFQLCIALLVAQSCRIMHRDLKPPNIMVTREEGHDFPIIKVIDFGLSRPVPPWMQPCTPVVQTTLYRAPELFMQQSKTPAGPDGRYVDGSEVKMYSSAIDMWSVGCILAELLRRENPFFADRDAAVMQKIQEIVGPLPEFYFQDPAFEDVYYVRRTQPKGDTLALVVPRVTEDPHCLSLLKGLLNYDPLQRLDPWKAINHPFFDEIRDIEMYRKELAWAVQQRHRLAKLRELTVLRRPKMRRSSSVSAETLSFCKTAS